MQQYRDQLQSISPSKRLVLAVSVMDWTLDEMGQLESGVVKDCINEGMRVAREAVRLDADELTLSEEMLDAWNDVDDQADEPGTTHVMSAILACADAPEGLSGEVLYGVLRFCYEAVRERFEEEGSVGSLEAELANVRCVEAISFQKSHIADALLR
ncbi:hypothetical protein [Streptacidiphilus sp. EB103A]|uniref:hypothetical protein n=1 Tax=Streptacidiphilus sp. EB103A TaxID=3156275 RepID=UPI0035135DF4